jgi:hypothetical protein
MDMCAGDGFTIHLMPSDVQIGTARVEQHFALQVDSLHDRLTHLLHQHLDPWQASLDGRVHHIVDPADPLDFGIGSLFIVDPENNVIECHFPKSTSVTCVEVSRFPRPHPTAILLKVVCNIRRFAKDDRNRWSIGPCRTNDRL